MSRTISIDEGIKRIGEISIGKIEVLRSHSAFSQIDRVDINWNRI